MSRIRRMLARQADQEGDLAIPAAASVTVGIAIGLALMQGLLLVA